MAKKRIYDQCLDERNSDNRDKMGKRVRGNRSILKRKDKEMENNINKVRKKEKWKK